MNMQRMQRVFLSYSREDREVVARLIHSLELLRYELWLDQSLSGGQVWWNEILSQIRICDIFVVTVSPAMLQSVACDAELKYAEQLGRTILPVSVQAVPIEMLPGSLAVIQLIDFTSSDQESAFALAGALRDLPPARALPQTLPHPPPPPLSYLTNLSEAIRSPALSVDDQLALTIRLEHASEKASDLPVIAQLCRLLLEREDLYHRAAKRIDKLLATIDKIDPPMSGATSLSASSPRSVSMREAGLPPEFWGSWAGTVTEFFSKYPLELHLHHFDSRSSVGEFKYSTLRVEGWLELQEAGDGTATLKEHATKRQGFKGRMMYEEMRVKIKLISPDKIHAVWSNVCRADLTRIE